MVQPLRYFQRVVPFLDKICQEKVDASIVELKNWKVPGYDDAAAKLIKYGEQLLQSIFKILNSIWIEKRLPIS